MKQLYLILIAIFARLTCLTAQTDSLDNKFRGFSISGHSGSHVYTGEKLAEALDNGYGAVNVRLHWISGPLSSSWKRYYGYPSFGIGVYSGAIGNPDILGTPNAIYGFASFPVYQTRKSSFFIEPAIGLTYDLKPYDSQENPLNDAIGSNISVYFNLNFGGRLWVSREMDFTYGFDLTHFSNGRTFTPNFGLNMAGLNIGMLYYFNRAQKYADNSLRPETILEVRPTLPPTSEVIRNSHFYFSLYQAIGTTQNFGATDGARYFNASTSIEAVYKHSMKHSWLVGFDVLYDGSLQPDYPEKSEQFAYAIHPGYDFSFWKLDIRAQVGIYLGDNKGKGSYFMRPALRYRFNDVFFAQVGLKTTSGFTADWVEFGAGFKLWSIKTNRDGLPYL